METKHTPGPWKIIKSDGFSGIIGNDQGDIITPTGPRIDDARLIAAAPELLGACVAMIEWDEREKDHAVNFHARMALCDAALLKARAAIAKATGESK